MEQNAHSISKELADIKSRFGTLDNIVEELRRHPGFEKVNRATVSRWLKKPSERAVMAVKVLRDQLVIKKFRIAIANTLWQLPAKVLLEDSYLALREKLKIEDILKRSGTEILLHQTNTGGQALDLLERGEVDLAFAARNYGNVGHIQCLCDIATAALRGISIKPIESRKAFFEQSTIGYPAASKVLDAVKQNAASWGVRHVKAKALGADQFATALLSGEVDCIIGWEPSIGQAKKIKGQIELYDITEEVLGNMQISLFINTKELDIKTLFPLLKALSKSTELIEQGKRSNYLIKAVKQAENLTEKDTLSILSDARYHIENFDIITLLNLRE